MSSLLCGVSQDESCLFRYEELRCSFVSDEVQTMFTVSDKFRKLLNNYSHLHLLHKMMITTYVSCQDMLRRDVE